MRELTWAQALVQICQQAAAARVPGLGQGRGQESGWVLMQVRVRGQGQILVLVLGQGKGLVRLAGVLGPAGPWGTRSGCDLSVGLGAARILLLMAEWGMHEDCTKSPVDCLGLCEVQPGSCWGVAASIAGQVWLAWALELVLERALAGAAEQARCSLGHVGAWRQAWQAAQAVACLGAGAGAGVGLGRGC